MNSKVLLIAASIAVSGVGFGQAAEPGKTSAPLQIAQSIPEEPIYGSQMMTQQERDAHRTRLRTAATEQEREQIRREHHEQMQARAKERGMTLPDEPPARGAGAGQGMGRGMGQGSGSGRGPGPGSSAVPQGGWVDTGQ